MNEPFTHTRAPALGQLSGGAREALRHAARDAAQGFRDQWNSMGQRNTSVWGRVQGWLVASALGLLVLGVGAAALIVITR